jgi:hypothetical protein
MSTDININISINNDAVLKEIQRRAAANQQALNDRIEKAKLEQAAEQSAQQTAQERPSAVPDIRLARSPAAQRRKYGSGPDPDPDPDPDSDSDSDLEFSIVSVLETKLKTVPNGLISITEAPWQYTRRSSFDKAGNIVFTLGAADNSYDEFSLQFAPLLTYDGTFKSLQTFVQNNTASRIRRWITEIEDFIDPKTVTSKGPPFPRQTVASPYLAATRRVLSVTPTDMFFSCIMVQYIYTTGTLIETSPNEPSFRLKLAAIQNFTVNNIGYYTKFNFETKTLSEKQVGLESKSVNGSPTTFFRTHSVPSPAILLSYIQNFYNGDPRKDLFTQSNNDYSAALDWNINSFAYSPELGVAYFYGAVNDVSKRTRRYVYRAAVEKFLPYQLVYYALLEGKNLLAVETTAPPKIFGTANKTTFTLVFNFTPGDAPPYTDEFGGDLGNFYGIRPPRV